MMRNFLAILLVAIAVSSVSAGSGSMAVNLYNATVLAGAQCSGTAVVSTTVSLGTINSYSAGSGSASVNYVNASTSSCVAIGTGSYMFYITGYCYSEVVSGSGASVSTGYGYYTIFNDSKCTNLLGYNVLSQVSPITPPANSSCAPLVAYNLGGTWDIYGVFSCSYGSSNYGTVVNVSVLSVLLTAFIACFISV